ncbi:hypothetical protein ACP4OV_027399 [Aristida adscensionis]
MQVVQTTLSHLQLRLLGALVHLLRRQGPTYGHRHLRHPRFVKKAQEEIACRRSDAALENKRKRAKRLDDESSPSETSPNMQRCHKVQKLPCRKNAANAGVSRDPIQLSSASGPSPNIDQRPRTRHMSKRREPNERPKGQKPSKEYQANEPEKDSEDEEEQYVEQRTRNMSKRRKPKDCAKSEPPFKVYSAKEPEKDSEDEEEQCGIGRAKKLNVRCKPGDVIHSIWIMNDSQRKMISEYGFGKLLELTVDGIESRVLLRWLLNRTSPVDMKIHAGPRYTLPITKEIVSQVLGLPRVGGQLPSIEYAEQVDANWRFRAELGLKKGDLSISILHNIIVEGRTDDLSMRAFFMILLNRLILPSSSWNISGAEIALADHWKTFGDIDWSQVVYNDLSEAVVRWHDRDQSKPTWTVYGCAIFFIVYYLDNFDHKHAPGDSFTTPRVKFYDRQLIDELTRADKKRTRDGSETFGHCLFKSWSNTCYAHFHVADHAPKVAESTDHRPVADRASASVIHMPRMTDVMSGRISRLKGSSRKIAQEIWLDYDREVQGYVRTMNNCHDAIVQMQLRCAERFQQLIDDNTDSDSDVHRRAAPTVGPDSCLERDVHNVQKDAAGAPGRIPPTAKGRRTEVEYDEITVPHRKTTESNSNDQSKAVASDLAARNDRNPIDGFSNLSSFATVGEVSVSHEPNHVPDHLQQNDVFDTDADFMSTQLGSEYLSPLPSQLPPESQLQGTQMERYIDKPYRAHIQEHPPSSEGRPTEPEASNETFTPSKYLESSDGMDADQAMDKGCASLYADPAYDVTPMSDGTREPIFDYTPMQPDEMDKSEMPNCDPGKEPVLRRYIRRPARFLSPFKTGVARIPKCADNALNLRAFLISPDCELSSSTVLEYGNLSHNAKDTANFFGDATFTDNFMIDAFITCLRDDDKRFRQECFGYRVFTHVAVAMTMNQEEVSNGREAFSAEALDYVLRQSLPASEISKGTKLIFTPMWHRHHWSAYVVNLIHARIDVLDSNDYGANLGGTTWADHHESMVECEGEHRTWNKLMIERLNDSFHRVFSRSPLPVFTNWRVLPVSRYQFRHQMTVLSMLCASSSSTMGSKESCPTHSRRSEEIRAEILHYLVFHPRNEVSKLPDVLDQFRGPPHLVK